MLEKSLACVDLCRMEKNVEWVDSGGNKGVYSRCQLMKLENGEELA